MRNLQAVFSCQHILFVKTDGKMFFEIYTTIKISQIRNAKHWWNFVCGRALCCGVSGWSDVSAMTRQCLRFQLRRKPFPLFYCSCLPSKTNFSFRSSKVSRGWMIGLLDCFDKSSRFIWLVHLQKCQFSTNITSSPWQTHSGEWAA